MRMGMTRRRMGALAWLACSRGSVALRLEPWWGKSRIGQGEGWRPPALRPSGKVCHVGTVSRPCGRSRPVLRSPHPAWLSRTDAHPKPARHSDWLDSPLPPASTQTIHTQQVFTAFLESRVLNQGAASPPEDTGQCLGPCHVGETGAAGRGGHPGAQ